MSAFRDTLKPVFAETDGKKSADSSEKAADTVLRCIGKSVVFEIVFVIINAKFPCFSNSALSPANCVKKCK